jgi:NADH:ubiquinone oxidoreductase subunit E/NAD-dependent dihydropyrimidine dehydrogenase PreA subunit
MKRIGVFICHCGINIAKTVDVEALTNTISEYPGVVHAENNKYMCSDPGQNLIIEAIKNKKLDAVVVAACSPTLHENTFRGASERGGLNRYVCEMATIREHCSWVHDDRAVATKKALSIIKGIVEKVRFNQSLDPILVDVTKRALVIGGGIAGIQSALDIANAGIETILVEQSPSVGGRMAQLSETFPTLDCSQCILTPKMVEVAQHSKIELLTYSEIEEISGSVGNYKVKIKKKPRYVDMAACTGCGDCMTACPVRNEPQIPEKPRYSKTMKPDEISALDTIINTYAVPGNGTPGKEMLIQIMQDINVQYRYLPEYALQYLSEKLDVSLPHVYHVATFYTAFSLKPRGKHIIKVCMGTACHARGAPKILEEFERQLEIPNGETTSDLMYTLETVNCLGCCALGPVVMIDEDYHSVSTSMVSGLIKKYTEVGG